jgi:hypothetical protein
MSVNDSNIQKKKISVVVGRYYIDHNKLETLISSFLKLLNPDNKYIIDNLKFVDLKYSELDIKNNLKFNWISKNPIFFDFSAFKEIERSNNTVLYIYINDTLFIKHPWRIIGKQFSERIDTASLLENSAAVGIVYPYSEALINDRSNLTLQHMTTFCFALNTCSNNIFHNLLNSLPESESKSDEWINNEIQSNLFLKYLMNIHIYGPKSPWSWKRANNNFTESALSGKAIAVILEYDLNAKILNSNGLIIPISRDLKYSLFQKIQSIIGRFLYKEYF